MCKDEIFSSMGYFYNPNERIWDDTDCVVGKSDVMRIVDYQRRYGIDLSTSDLDWWIIPHQDQLQKMCDLETNQEIYYSTDHYWITERGEEASGDDVCGRTWEQLWLAFVMKEKFNKVWKDGKWNTRNTQD